MSKQLGVIKLKGTIGGISFYQSDGEHLARLANGPDKSRIDTDVAFQRTRENNAEFGGSAVAAKALRISLTSAMQVIADSKISSRLTQLFKAINMKGTGTRGQRSILVSANQSMLVNFELDVNKSFSSVFNAPYTVTNGADRNDATLTVAAFIPASFVAAPAGATHFRLIHAIGIISDYLYNNDTQDYEPSEPTLNSIGAIDYSAYLPVGNVPTAAISINTVLPGAPVMPVDASVVQCVGIEFYQQIAGVNYPLTQGSAMKIARVF